MRRYFIRESGQSTIVAEKELAMRAISKHAQFEDLFLGAYYLPAHLERRIHRKVGEGVEPSGIRVSSGIISNPSSTGSVISEGGSTGPREDSEVRVFSSGISYPCIVPQSGFWEVLAPLMLCQHPNHTS